MADRLELNYGELSGRERAIAADILRWARKLTDVQGYFLCVLMKDWYDAVTDAINELEQ